MAACGVKYHMAYASGTVNKLAAEVPKCFCNKAVEERVLCSGTRLVPALIFVILRERRRALKLEGHQYLHMAHPD